MLSLSAAFCIVLNWSKVKNTRMEFETPGPHNNRTCVHVTAPEKGCWVRDIGKKLAKSEAFILN